MILLTANRILALKEAGILSVVDPAQKGGILPVSSSPFQGVLDVTQTNVSGYHVNTYYELYQAFRSGLLFLSLQKENRIVKGFLYQCGVESFGLRPNTYAYYHPIHGLSIHQLLPEQLCLPVLQDGVVCDWETSIHTILSMTFPYFECMDLNELVFYIEKKDFTSVVSRRLVPSIKEWVKNFAHQVDLKEEDWSKFKSDYVTLLSKLPWSWGWAGELRQELLGFLNFLYIRPVCGKEQEYILQAVEKIKEDSAEERLKEEANQAQGQSKEEPKQTQDKNPNSEILIALGVVLVILGILRSPKRVQRLTHDPIYGPLIRSFMKELQTILK